MTRTQIVVSLFCAAVLCGTTFLWISDATVAPLMSRGPGPSGVHINASGWLALFMSLFGTSGFTLAGIWTVLSGRGNFPISGEKSSNEFMSEVIELTSSFSALMRDKSNRATQRRFLFALVDAARLIEGCETSHDSGVIVIRYSGYADCRKTTIEQDPAVGK